MYVLTFSCIALVFWHNSFVVFCYIMMFEYICGGTITIVRAVNESITSQLSFYARMAYKSKIQSLLAGFQCTTWYCVSSLEHLLIIWAESSFVTPALDHLTPISLHCSPFLVPCLSVFEGLGEAGFAFFRFHMFVTSYNIFLSVNTIL